jgi:hypothetical protein
VSVDLNKRIDLTCPVCGMAFHQTVGWFVKHSEVICARCQSPYEINIADPKSLGPKGFTALVGSSFFTKIAGVTHRNNERRQVTPTHNLTGGDGLTRGVNIEIGEWPEDSHLSEAATPDESVASYGWIVSVVIIVVVAVVVILLLVHTR